MKKRREMGKQARCCQIDGRGTGVGGVSRSAFENGFVDKEV
jgi:hypothetical protein